MNNKEPAIKCFLTEKEKKIVIDKYLYKDTDNKIHIEQEIIQYNKLDVIEFYKNICVLKVIGNSYKAGYNYKTKTYITFNIKNYVISEIKQIFDF